MLAVKHNDSHLQQAIETIANTATDSLNSNKDWLDAMIMASFLEFENECTRLFLEYSSNKWPLLFENCNDDHTDTFGTPIMRSYALGLSNYVKRPDITNEERYVAKYQHYINYAGAAFGFNLCTAKARGDLEMVKAMETIAQKDDDPSKTPSQKWRYAMMYAMSNSSNEEILEGLAEYVLDDPHAKWYSKLVHREEEPPLYPMENLDFRVLRVNTYAYDTMTI